MCRKSLTNAKTLLEIVEDCYKLYGIVFCMWYNGTIKNIVFFLLRKRPLIVSTIAGVFCYMIIVGSVYSGSGCSLRGRKEPRQILFLSGAVVRKSLTWRLHSCIF